MAYKLTTVKMMITDEDGKTRIGKIAGAGELLGLQTVVTGKRYELTVKTLQPSQLPYIGADQFLKFLTMVETLVRRRRSISVRTVRGIRSNFARSGSAMVPGRN